VKQLTADNPRQQERIPILERKIADRLEDLKTAIDLRKNNDAEGARQLILSGSGKRMMDDLRKFIDGMESDENELLRQRMEESRISQRDTFLTFGIASVIACFLLLLVAYVVMRDFRARREAAEALREQQQLLQVTLASIWRRRHCNGFQRICHILEPCCGITDRLDAGRGARTTAINGLRYFE
jgi:hypothetical protein